MWISGGPESAIILTLLGTIFLLHIMNFSFTFIIFSVVFLISHTFGLDEV